MLNLNNKLKYHTLTWLSFYYSTAQVKLGRTLTCEIAHDYMNRKIFAMCYIACALQIDDVSMLVDNINTHYGLN